MLKKIFLFLIFIFLVFSRFLYLDRFPIGISHDELEYILSAKSYFSSGTDLSGSSFPASIFQTNTLGSISFLPALILSPYYGLIHLNQFTARLPYIIINLLTAFVFYLLVKKLFQNKNFAILSSILFLANPWSFYLSRTASDTAFALLFYLLAINFILNKSPQKLFLSFLFFVLGFFSYHGAKPILIPLVLVCLFYSKIHIKPKLLFLSSIIAIFSLYLLGSRFFPSSASQTRSQEILFLNKDLISQTVNTDRQASLESPFKNIFTNKLTISLEIFSQKYFSAFSPDTLFISGDNSGTYRFGRHGLFYLVDFIFIIIGLISLFKKYPHQAKFLSILILISPLATAISTVGTSTINRSFLLFPILIIFSSFGIYLVNKLLSLLIFISFTGFLYFYFFRFPIIGQENYFLSQRIIANYIVRNNTSNIIVIDSEPREVFLETLFYSSKNKVENTTFISTCPKDFDPKITYIIKSSICPLKIDNIKSINEEQFGGPLYYIVNDSFCSSYPSQKYLRFHLTKDYLLEKMENSNFCQTWIKSI